MSSWWSFGSGATAKKESAAVSQAAPSQQSFKAMSNAFRKGVQYNMKIVLRGDVMTGKSNLFHRLQGSDFNEEYASTPQIQVANIPWHYKDSNDIVKIEVWDVVDKVHNKNKSESKGIKLEHKPSDSKMNSTISAPQSPTQQQEDQDAAMGLDASTVNVYRNTHGAILMFDTTKPWTFDYVNKELKNVPESMAVLVLGNFCDKTEERKVELDTIHATLYEHNQERIKKGAIKPNLIRYAETSMQTGLGLKYIYEYLGVPFLQLMIESLNKQLELKAVEIVDLLETLDTDDDVPAGMQRRRGQDNFDQPSEPRLARQQEEMKSAWDQELENIASDHPTMLDSFPHIQETPPVPTSPVKSKKKKDVKLVPEQIPAVVDFNVGDELNDDWFGEDTNANIDLPKPDKQDSDDEGPGNPMVLGDEDVEPIFYSRPTHERSIAVQKEHELEQIYEPLEEAAAEEEEEQADEQAEEEEQYQPVFKSELNDVWSRSLRRLSGPEVISDSEDEDNRIRRTDSPFAPESPFMESPTFQSGFVGGYEEIGGSNENPWSIGQSKLVAEKPIIQHEWDHETEQGQGIKEENVELDTTAAITEQPTVEKSKKKESSNKKKKSSSSSSNKKKSGSSKKKKSSTNSQ